MNELNVELPVAREAIQCGFQVLFSGKNLIQHMDCDNAKVVHAL